MGINKQAIIVTGALGGIGSSIVEEFNRQDWLVIPLDFIGEINPSMALVDFDLRRFVSDQEYRNKNISRIERQIPDDVDRLVLVNNAAVQKLAPATDLTWNDWEESFAVNVLAPFFLSQSLFERLRKHDGRVINIGSIHATLTKPGFAAYATSKGALNNLTRSLAIEWAPAGIAVNGICPAAIDTPMLREGFAGHDATLKGLAGCHPTQAIGQPVDVASVVSMLATYSGKFLTGSLLDLSGGISSVLHDPA